MNMRDSALDLMQVLQVALSRYEDKLSREVSLELVEHFVEHNKRIDQILGFVQKTPPKEPTAQLEAPAQPQLEAPEPSPAVAEPPPVTVEPVPYVPGQTYDPEQVVLRKGILGRMRWVAGHRGPLPNGDMFDYPALQKFFPLTVKGYTKRRSKPPSANLDDPSIVMRNGLYGRMIKVKGWVQRKSDGTIHQDMPDHERFRPLGKKELARLSAKEPAPEPEIVVVNGRSGKIIQQPGYTQRHGASGKIVEVRASERFWPLDTIKKGLTTREEKMARGEYPENDVVVNGVHGRWIRIPAHNKMNGTKFIMVPAKEIFRPWKVNHHQGPRGPYKATAR